MIETDSECIECGEGEEGSPWGTGIFLESVIKTAHLYLDRYTCTQSTACHFRAVTRKTDSPGLRIPVWRTNREGVVKITEEFSEM